MMKNLLIILMLATSTNLVFGCSCLKVGILKNQHSADFVFTGKVVGVNKIESREKITGTELIADYVRFEFVFNIKHIHKGKKEFNQPSKIAIITTGGVVDCGNNFQLNKKYLVYAYREQNKIDLSLYDQKAKQEFLSTNLCTRTKSIGMFTFLEQFILELT